MIKILNTIKNIGLTSILIIAVILIALIFGLMVIQTPKQIYAFPSAEGYGAFTTGGRGGVVYHVRTLQDTGELGSLRYAIEQKGPRTIVFEVTGNIELKSPLEITNNDLTIAGQTAPGDGVCIKNFPLIINADNVIIRYLRFRPGSANNNAIVAKNRHDIILDHCSLSWGGADNVALYNNRKLTMQWCIISEALTGGKGMGATLGGYSASYHHNLFASNKIANPEFYKSTYTNNLNLETVDFRNNVLYNWGTSSANGSGSGTYNLINNYYKFGPATNLASRSQILEFTNFNKNGIIYVSGNFVNINPLQTNDNWMGVYPNTDYIKTSKNPLVSYFEFEHEPVTLHSSDRAYKQVLEFAGASLKRDFTDSRITQSVETFVSGTISGSGLISSPTDVGGYEEFKKAPPNIDSDNDGIPDDWEFAHNLNPYDSGDAKSLTQSGYTHLEVYLNSLVENITNKQNNHFLPTIDTFKILVQKTANKIKK